MHHGPCRDGVVIQLCRKCDMARNLFDSAVATEGFVNCKARGQIGMPSSETFIQKCYENVKKYPTMGEWAAAPDRGQGLLQGTVQQHHGRRGSSNEVGGISTVCPCPVLVFACAVVGPCSQLYVCVFRWIWDPDGFLRPVSERKSHNFRGGNGLIRFMSLFRQRRLCIVSGQRCQCYVMA